MSVENIVGEVRAEISRLQQVLVLLGDETGHNVPGKKSVAPTGEQAPKRRKISAASRNKIAAAQKARWAKFRATKK